VVQALELHGAYHIGVEFTRALRDGVKQLLRTHKLPEVRQGQLASLNALGSTPAGPAFLWQCGLIAAALCVVSFANEYTTGL
jgi:hypothetical protein